MKATQIDGFFCEEAGYYRYYAFYHTKIEGKDVILTRLLQRDREAHGATLVEKLYDEIVNIDSLR